ncbi:hypothetical protein NQ314_011871 [Rhamnusium bicolor]|uniref:Uncharacterized protein n=1 Tax=Rhamnusium bicolor TaxID=1586634 RepID=A0AAV8XFF2_9CUCU|nr:hypothetical protein NQ314_011871 [Rhamnusium bicolor]
MKLFAFVVLITAVVAEKLQSNYLPPSSANSAGGSSNFLSAPRPEFSGTLVATSYAAPPSGPVPSGLYNAPTRSYSTGTPVAILRLNNENNGDGTYRFEYETENKISQQEQGHVENVSSGQESSVVHGSYSYQAPDGQTITVNYVADENGFRASGDHIPTPPPIPAAIQKSLEINAAASRATGYPGSSTGATAIPNFGSTFQQPQVSSQYLAPSTQPAGGYRY